MDNNLINNNKINETNENKKFVDEIIFFKVWRNIYTRRIITGIDRIKQIEMVTERINIVKETYEKNGYDFNDEMISGSGGRFVFYNSSVGHVSGQNWTIHDYIFGIKDKLDTIPLFDDFDEKLKFKVFELFRNNGLSRFIVNNFINDYLNTLTTTTTSLSNKIEIRKEILNNAIQYHLKRKEYLINILNKHGLKYLELSSPIEDYEKYHFNINKLSNDDKREWKMYSYKTNQDIENLINDEFEYIKSDKSLKLFKALDCNKLFYNKEIFKKTEIFKQFINDYSGNKGPTIQQIVENEKLKVNQIKDKINQLLIENELELNHLSIYNELVQDCFSCNDLNDSLLSINKFINSIIKQVIQQRELDLLVLLRDYHSIYGTSMNSKLSRDYLNTIKKSERDLKFNFNEIIENENFEYNNKIKEFKSMILDYNIEFDEKEFQTYLDNFWKDENNHHLYFNFKLDKVKQERKDILIESLEKYKLKFRDDNQSFQTFINTTKISEQLKLPTIDQIIQEEIKFIETIKSVIIKNFNDLGFIKKCNKEDEIILWVYMYVLEGVEVYNENLQYLIEKKNNKIKNN